MSDTPQLTWQYWPIIRPILSFLSSRKFVALVVSVLITEFGLDLSDNVQALIYMLAAGIYTFSTAIEDAASKRAGL